MELNNACWLLFTSLFVALICWANSKISLTWYYSQQACVCADGRGLGQPVSEAKLGVDDTSRNNGLVTMQCAFPTAAYQCDVVGEGWFDSCAASASVLDSSPLFPLGSWPLRLKVTTVQCCERACLGHSRCSKTAWDCADGNKCDAYEKAARVCASHYLHRDQYACFVVPGAQALGIHEDAQGFPLAWVVADVAAISLLGFALFSFASALAEGDFSSLESEVVNCFCSCALCGLTSLIFGIGALVVGYFGGFDEVKGVELTDFKDLAVGGANATEVLPPEPEPVTTSGWMYMMYIGFFGVSACMLIGLAGLLIKRQKQRREEDEDEDEDETASMTD